MNDEKLKTIITHLTRDEAIDKLQKIMCRVKNLWSIDFRDYEGIEHLEIIAEEFVYDFVDDIYNIIEEK